MAKRLPVCWPVTSNKISTEQAAENSAACFSSLVNYTIKCNTLGEQKEVHTEPW